MDNLEKARKIIKHFVGLLVIRNNICVNIQDIGKCADQILFELIKNAFIAESEKDLSLNKISGLGYEAELKKHSRTMQYSNYYRDQSAQKFKEDYDFIPPELVVPDMTNRDIRTVGYQLSSYDVEQIEAIESLKLLKTIANRRITDVKKLDNTELDIEFAEYLDYFKEKFTRPYNDDYDFILYSILLFTTELKYRAVTIYHMADRLSMYQNSKSKNKFPDDYITRMSFFNANFVMNSDKTQYRKENSLILMRLETIKSLTPDNLIESSKTYFENLKLCMIGKQMVLHSPETVELIQQSSNAERRTFIETYYPIHTILDMELTWGNKKEKYIRDLYKALVQEIEPPKIG